MKLTKETGVYQKIVDEKKKRVEELAAACEARNVDVEVGEACLEENPDMQEDEVAKMREKISAWRSELAADSLAKLWAEEDLAKNEKIIRKICAVARSDKSKQQIASDFMAGIRDMHRKANGREDDNDDDFDDENDVEDAFFASKASGFKVFSVFSSDYLKLKSLKPGTSRVFDDVRDTGIEDLIESSHTLSE